MPRPKIPCPVCGVNDVDNVATRECESGRGYINVTVHTNGDECAHESGEVIAKAWRAYKARQV
jgi:hypothetical protein